MKHEKQILHVCSIIFFLNAAELYAGVPVKSFQPGAIWPDNNGVHINAHAGGILVHDGVYYWFGQHMVEGRAGNKALVGVHVYSSSDLYNWKDEGIALEIFDDPNSDLAKGCILERPKVVFNRRTGKFVMWFHLELRGHGYKSARSGVAMAENPLGPYKFLKSFRPNAGVWPINVPQENRKPLSPEQVDYLNKQKFSGGSVPAKALNLIYRRDFTTGQMARDMTLFVDRDGTAYHIYASEENSTLHISQLSEDYLKPAGKYMRVFPAAFNEAPALFKHNGKYWLLTSGCTGWQPNAARLAVADSIWGPWQALGNPCVGVNPQNNLGPEKTFGGDGSRGWLWGRPGRDTEDKSEQAKGGDGPGYHRISSCRSYSTREGRALQTESPREDA